MYYYVTIKLCINFKKWSAETIVFIHRHKESRNSGERVDRDESTFCKSYVYILDEYYAVCFV